MIDLETFARTVRDMRRCQDRYFATRDVTALCGARQREAQVDRLVEDVLAGGDLFERAARARECAGEGVES